VPLILPLLSALHFLSQFAFASCRISRVLSPHLILDRNRRLAIFSCPLYLPSALTLTRQITHRCLPPYAALNSQCSTATLLLLLPALPSFALARHNSPCSPPSRAALDLKHCIMPFFLPLLLPLPLAFICRHLPRLSTSCSALYPQYCVVLIDAVVIIVVSIVIVVVFIFVVTIVIVVIIVVFFFVIVIFVVFFVFVIVFVIVVFLIFFLVVLYLLCFLLFLFLSIAQVITLPLVLIILQSFPSFALARHNSPCSPPSRAALDLKHCIMPFFLPLLLPLPLAFICCHLPRLSTSCSALNLHRRLRIPTLLHQLVPSHLPPLSLLCHLCPRLASADTRLNAHCRPVPLILPLSSALHFLPQFAFASCRISRVLSPHLILDRNRRTALDRVLMSVILLSIILLSIILLGLLLLRLQLCTRLLVVLLPTLQHALGF
jgi:hypothetical protein